MSDTSEIRADFEHWYTGNTDGNLAKTKGDFYVYMPAQVAWNTWQACAKHYEATINTLNDAINEDKILVAYVKELEAKIAELDGMLGKRNLHKEAEYLQKLAILEARCKELENALKHADMFITNGIELGFIIMPDDDTPDTAHDTPKIVKQTLSTHTTDEHLQSLFKEWMGEAVAWKIRHHEDDENDWRLSDVEQVYIGSWDVIPLYAPKKVSE